MARTRCIKPPSVASTVGTVTAESLLFAKQHLITATQHLTEKTDALVAKIEDEEEKGRNIQHLSGLSVKELRSKKNAALGDTQETIDEVEEQIQPLEDQCLDDEDLHMHNTYKEGQADLLPPGILHKVQVRVLNLKSVWPPKTDIKNRFNTTCSVWKVTFDIRRSFIDHCQLVHGRKFKTKSGLSIPPPPVPEAQDGWPDPPTTAKPGDQQEEAKRACSSGQQRNVINALLDDSSEDGESQSTTYAGREPGGTDPLGLNNWGEEDAHSSEYSEKEDSSWKNSANENEGQRHPGRSSRAGSAPPGGKHDGRVRRRAAPSSEDGPQTKVEGVRRFGLSKGPAGSATTWAQKQTARRPTTEGPSNSSRSPRRGPAVHSPHLTSRKPSPLSLTTPPSPLRS